MDKEKAKELYELFKNGYQQMPEPGLRSMLAPIVSILEKEASEPEPANEENLSQIEQTREPTATNKTIARAIGTNDNFETTGDDLEPGTSADNPIDSKSLTYEAQAQLPIGTWVTTSKGPHRINQGDINWAKQQMQKKSQVSQISPTPQAEQSSQEDEVQSELEGAPRIFSEDSNSWDIRKENSVGNLAVTNVSLIPKNISTYGELLQLKADYDKAYNDARDKMSNDKDADAYAKRRVGMNCIGNGGSVIDEVIRNAQNVMDSERKKSSKAASKTEKAAQKNIYESSPEGKAAAQKAREDAEVRAAERAERNADRHDR